MLYTPVRYLDQNLARSGRHVETHHRTYTAGETHDDRGRDCQHCRLPAFGAREPYHRSVAICRWGICTSRPGVGLISMRKYCLALDLRDDPALIAAYEDHHRHVWPEIIQSIRDAGIVQME